MQKNMEAPQVALVVKNPPASSGDIDTGGSPGLEDPLEVPVDCNTHLPFLCECGLFGVLPERERSRVLRTVGPSLSACLSVVSFDPHSLMKHTAPSYKGH